MRYSILLIVVTFLSLTSCRKDFDTKPSNGNLEFSKTTVYLDTVFTNTSSSTYTLKVYNRSNDDINIPSIALGKGDNSKYRIMVDGMSGRDGKGKYFENVELLAKDSMYLFIEATANIADANPTDFLYTDKILFDGGSNQQSVDLVTLIQDAVFLYPERTSNGTGGYTYESLQLDDNNPDSKIYGFELNESDPVNGNELHFTNTKPYVIYGYAGVPANKTLVIDAGARIHFHDQSGIFVKNNGSIQVNGTPSTDPKVLENEVIFEGDRLEPGFAEVPGQWGIIYLAEGSKNNTFNHATIKNSTVGIFVDRQEPTSTVQIKNTQIYNASNYGIIARKGKISGENIVTNKCGQSSLACILGGTYDFSHCSFTNFWTNGSRQTPSVYLDNTYLQNDVLFVSDLNANFTSCLIYGSNSIEVGVKQNVAGQCNVDVQYSLIKFQDNNNQFGSNPLYSFVTNPAPKNNIVANNATPNDPKFKNTGKNDLRILSGSSAIAKGKDLVTPFNDINNVPRPTSPQKPDVGAYQHLP